MQHLFARSGAEFIVNGVTAGAQLDSVVIALESGRFAMLWLDTSGAGADTAGPAVKARIYDASGTPEGAELTANSRTDAWEGSPVGAALPDDGFVAAWHDHAGIRAQLFDRHGARKGDELNVNAVTGGTDVAPAITSLQSGGFSSPGLTVRRRGQPRSVRSFSGLMASGSERISRWHPLRWDPSSSPWWRDSPPVASS